MPLNKETNQTIYLTHRYDPIRCYYSGPKWSWELWQWRGVPHSQKLLYYWNLTIRFFVSYTWHSAEVKSVYSTVPTHWAILNYCKKLPYKGGVKYIFIVFVILCLWYLVVSCSCVSTMEWLHCLDFNNTLGEKSRWRLHKDADCYFQHIPEAITHKTLALRVPMLQTIQVRQAKHPENCWISCDEPMRKVLLWGPHT